MSPAKVSGDRKQQILEAAVACFIEQGFHQTGVRDIARRAGVSIGNVYNHFTGKSAILTAIAALEAEELEAFMALLNAEGPASWRLERFVADYSTYAALQENAFLSLELTGEAARTPDVATLFLRNRHGLLQALAAVVAEMRQQEAPEEEALESARLVLDVIEGHALRVLINRRAASALEIGQLQRFIAAAVTGG